MIAGARCLVTGGAGMVGSAIVDRLIAAGAAEVAVLDDLSRGRRAHLAAAVGEAGDRVRVIEGDVRDRALVRALMEGVDLLFHQAGIRITQGAREPRLALEVLVDGTFEVIEAAADKGVRKVVAASSASVYGTATEFPTPEDRHPYANDTFYGAAKTFNEGMLRSFHATRGLALLQRVRAARWAACRGGWPTSPPCASASAGSRSSILRTGCGAWSPGGAPSARPLPLPFQPRVRRRPRIRRRIRARPARAEAV